MTYQSCLLFQPLLLLLLKQAAAQETSLNYIASLASNLTQASGNSLQGSGADLVTIFSGPQASTDQTCKP